MAQAEGASAVGKPVGLIRKGRTRARVQGIARELIGLAAGIGFAEAVAAVGGAAAGEKKPPLLGVAA
jgi:hypothetical protein